MVALKNGIIQNKNGHSFNRSTGTWEKSDDETLKPNDETPKPNAAENPDEVKEDNENKQTDAKDKQTDAEQKPSDAKTKETPAENPNQNAKTKETPAKPPKPDDEILKTPAGTLKPLTIDLYIDGKQIHFPFDDLSHFNELRAQLASGIPLDDDLIRKIKPILAEAHLRDGTKIFNDETKLSQLDDIMKHHRGTKISSFSDVLEFVFRKIR